MVDFIELRALNGAVLGELDTLLADAEQEREAEARGAAAIQRVFRGRRVRKSHQRRAAAITLIARSFRGHMGRVRAMQKRQQAQKDLTEAVKHYHAMLIQTAFRGYFSRKFRHDHLARKAHIRTVVERGNELMRKLNEHMEEQARLQKQQDEEEAAREFREVTQNLHHLVSTASIPGIYNIGASVSADALDGGTGGSGARDDFAGGTDNIAHTYTVMNEPVENCIRGAVKDLLRTRGYRKSTSDMVVGTQGTRTVRPQLPPSRRSLQASAAYDLPVRTARKEDRLRTLKFLGPRNLSAGARIKPPRYERGLADGDPYIDPFKNPLMQRGIPKSAKDMDASVDEAPPAPFYTAVGGNKSTARDNKDFDVILEAEYTGGVTQRHKATARMPA